VHPVHLLIVASHSIELQPLHAAEVVLSLAGARGRGALDVVGLGLDPAVLRIRGAQVEQRDLLLGEFVVAGQAVRGFWTGRDRVVEREGRDVGHDAVVEARVVACGVEEGGYGAIGDGCGVGGGGGAGVVLGASADGDVSECQARADGSERCGCWWGC
jgi:hypothetical protein